jgi:general secretion pathway protein G
MTHLKRKKRGGFTLIEIMLVVVIIGIIVGIAAPKIGGMLGIGQAGGAEAGIKGIETAVEAYRMQSDNVQLPDSLDDLTKSVDGKPALLKPSQLKDPWGQQFQYSKSSSHGYEFDVWTTSPEGEEFNNWD